MQKNYFSLLTFWLLFCAQQSFAQCPGCIVNLPALAEDTVFIANPATGQVGVYYEDDLSFRLPKTTATVDPSFDPPLNINNIEIIAVTGIPPGLQYEANQTDFDVQEETDGCVKFCGTPLLADSFYVEVVVEASVFGLSQTTSFLIPFLIEPATTITEGFSMTNNVGCGSTTVEFTNNISGTEGVSYFWDFGNGTTSSEENPAAITYDEAGTYTVDYEAVIDTSGYFLTQITIEESDCTDLIGTGDFYVVVSNPSGSIIHTSATISSNPPIIFDIPSIELTGGSYTIQVFDDDPFTQVNCGTVNFTFSTTGTLSDADLVVNTNIINPMTTVSSTGEVTVYATPPTPQISPAAVEELCAGTPVTLETEAYENIQWYRDTSLLLGEISTNLSVNTSGNYSVIYTNAEGCTAVSETVGVDFIPLPAQPNFVFNENELSLVNPNALPSSYTLQWYLNGNPIPNATDIIICMEESGDYALTVSDLDTGCSNTYEQYQVFLPGLGCDMTPNDNLNIKHLQLSPNPASTFIQFDLPIFKQGILSIYDLRGVLILEQPVHDSGIQQVNISSLNTGLYLVKVESENSIYRAKFIKK